MRAGAAIIGICALIASGPARADDECFVPMAQWQPRAVVETFAAQQGWRIESIEIDDGCLELEGRDSEGHEFEVKLHPETLEIIEFEGHARPATLPPSAAPSDEAQRGCRSDAPYLLGAGTALPFAHLADALN